MKKFRKLTAMVTALCLAGCMFASFSAFAESDEDTNTSTPTQVITITQEEDSLTHTYEAYQIFKGAYADGVLSDIDWGSGVNQSITVEENTSSILDAITNIDVGTSENPDKLFASCTDASSVAEVLSGLQDAINNATNDTKATAEAKKETVLKAFANAIAPFLNSNNKITSSQVKDEKDNVSYEINVSTAGAGYYLVQDSDTALSGNGSKTRYMLQVIGDTTVEATAKNSSPSVIKKVLENVKEVTDYAAAEGSSLTSLENLVNSDNGEITTDNGWNDVADYNIGDTVPFKLYGSLPSTLDDYDHYYYEFQDTIASSLTLYDGNDEDSIVDVVVKVVNEVTTNDDNGTTKSTVSTTVDSSKYTVTEIKDSNNKVTGFTVVFNDILSLNTDTSTVVTKDSIITVEYSATLNNNAVIGLDGQENAVKLVYSNNPNNTGNGTGTPDDTGETPEDKVIVFTYELDITKVDGTLYETWQKALESNSNATANANTYLKDAEFLLYSSVDEDGNAQDLVPIYSKSTTTGDVTTVEYMVWNETLEDGETATIPTGWTEVTSSNALKTDTDGKIKIKGLDDGTYYLKETKAPTGYNTLEGLVKLEIDASTQNNQNWSGTPSAALKDNDGKGGVKLTVDNDTTNVTYSLYGNKNNVITDDGTVNAIIKNNKGSSLPSTGGIGTTIFYMVGGVLVVGAGVTLIAKKRMKNNEQ